MGRLSPSDDARRGRKVGGGGCVGEGTNRAETGAFGALGGKAMGRVGVPAFEHDELRSACVCGCNEGGGEGGGDRARVRGGLV